MPDFYQIRKRQINGNIWQSTKKLKTLYFIEASDVIISRPILWIAVKCVSSCDLYSLVSILVGDDDEEEEENGGLGTTHGGLNHLGSSIAVVLVVVALQTCQVLLHQSIVTKTFPLINFVIVCYK